jgi:hypothetical protein
MKFGTHSTSHLTSISHLTSKPTHNALHCPARWWRWEGRRALYRAQEAWPCCRLKAYVGSGYVIACRHIRTAYSVANISKWALQGVGKINHLDTMLRSKKKAALTGPVS